MNVFVNTVHTGVFSHSCTTLITTVINQRQRPSFFNIRNVRLITIRHCVCTVDTVTVNTIHKIKKIDVYKNIQENKENVNVIQGLKVLFT